MDEFYAHRSLPLDERIAQLEYWASRFSSRTPSRAGQAASTAGVSLTGAVPPGPAPGVVLAGDVTGPASANIVSLLQGITLTLTSPATGQILTYNGTAIVNLDTVTGNLTITGITTTGGFRTAVTTKSGLYTLLYTDELLEADASGAPFTVTLPTAVGHAGQWFEVKKIDSTANGVTIATTGGQTIDGGATAVILMPQTSLAFRSNGANWDLV